MWIKTKDKLPEYDLPVIVLADNGMYTYFASVYLDKSIIENKPDFWRYNGSYGFPVDLVISADKVICWHQIPDQQELKSIMKKIKYL